MTTGAARATAATPKKPNNRLREITSDIGLSFRWLERRGKAISFREGAHLTRTGRSYADRSRCCLPRPPGAPELKGPTGSYPSAPAGRRAPPGAPVGLFVTHLPEGFAHDLSQY